MRSGLSLRPSPGIGSGTSTAGRLWRCGYRGRGYRLARGRLRPQQQEAEDSSDVACHAAGSCPLARRIVGGGFFFFLVRSPALRQCCEVACARACTIHQPPPAAVLRAFAPRGTSEEASGSVEPGSPVPPPPRAPAPRCVSSSPPPRSASRRAAEHRFAVSPAERAKQYLCELQPHIRCVELAGAIEIAYASPFPFTESRHSGS